MSTTNSTLFLQLAVHQGEDLREARIQTFRLDGKHPVRLSDESRLVDIDHTWDDESGRIRVEGLAPGAYRLVISAPEVLTERTIVQLQSGDNYVDLMLARPGERYFYAHGRKRFIEEPDLWVEPIPVETIHEEHATPRPRAAIHAEGDDLRGHRHHVRVIRGNPRAGQAPRSTQRWTTEETERAERYPVIEITEDSLTVLHGSAFVQFARDLRWEEIVELAEEYDIQIMHPVGSKVNAYVVTLCDLDHRERIVDVCNALVETGMAVKAEPNVISTIKPLQILPGDILRPEQWHLGVVKAYDAWQYLRDYSQNVLGVGQADAADITYGRTDVIIAVFDTGIPSQTVAGVVQPVPPDFTGNVKDGSAKVYGLFNFRPRTRAGVLSPMPADNDQPEGSHGIMCAGIAAALTDLGGAAGPLEGVAGAAPNARVVGAIWTGGPTYGMSNYHFERAWEFLAGVDPRWAAGGGNYHAAEPFFGAASIIGRGAGILSNSYSNPSAATNAATDTAISNAVVYGRNRRGVLFLFAAGNSDAEILDPTAPGGGNGTGNHRRLIMVAASTVDHDGREVRTSYSNFHRSSTWFPTHPGTGAGASLFKPEALSGGANPDRIGIDFAAPSHNWYFFDTLGVGHIVHNPPENRGVYTTGLVNANGLPAGVAFDSNATGRPQAASLALTVAVPDPSVALTNQITVNNPAPAPALPAGTALLIGDPGANNDTESVVVNAAVFNGPPVNTIVITLTQSMKNPHPIGTNVYYGPAEYADHMGGTSAACPLAAGVAGLVVSAKPTLTNYEVRELMRSTAVPIDLTENYRGPWLGTSPANLGVPNTPANPLLSLLDANGFLNLQGPNANLSAATLRGATQITVTVNRNNYRVKQAILIGAQGQMTAAAGPSAVPVGITLNSVAGFAVGQSVTINAGPSTFFAGAPFAANPNVICVGHTRGFRNNDVITVAGANYTILNVFSSSILVLTANYGGPNVFPQVPEIPVRLATSEVRVISAVNAGTNTITVPALTNAYGIGTRIEVVGTEVTVVKELPAGNPNALIVEPLIYDHPIAGTTIPVRGGRMPFYSNALGFGRIDAAAAVQAALAYSHNDRDLMIRNSLNDNGADKFTPTGFDPVSSPDLWIRNTVPTDPAETLGAVPLGYPFAGSYGLKGPHQIPAIANNRWIYARVKNRGASLESLDASVRFYIALKHKNAAAISITDFDQSVVRTVNGAGIITAVRNWGLSTDSTTEGSEYLGESFIYAVTGLTRGIAPGATFLTNIQWPAASTPPATPAGVAIADRMRVYVLAEIIPHDGVVRDPVSGNYLDSRAIGENNNITYKEITFAQATIKQTSVLPFPAKFEVPRAGDVATQPFRIEISDQIGLFPANGLEVTVTRRAIGGAETTVTYAFTGGPPSWSPSLAGQTWLTVNAPKILSGAGAGTDANTGTDQIGVYIEGTFDASKVHDKVTVKVRLLGYDFAVLLEQSQSLTVEELAVHYQNLEINSPERPDIHFFTDPANLVQTDALAFGPKSDTVYRLTSSFTYSGTGAPRCYAAATGLLMVQRIFDITGAADPCRVNVIIKPLRQTALGFTPVKYFIYRGVNLEDLLTSDATKVRDKNLAGGSPFITEFYDFLQERIDDFDASPLATSRPALRPDPQPTSVAFGWDSARPVADPVSKYFHDNGTAFQLPLIVRGTDFGSFFVSSATDEFGFEIVLEGEYEPRIGDVRTIANVLDITTLVAANPPAFDLKWKKETILSYLDPAAYYGMHWKLGVYTRQAPATTSSRTKETDLYNDVIAKFATKNVVWFDLRNENGYSYNYYDNVNPGSDQLKIGITMDAMCSMPYATSGWPIVQFKRTGAEVTASFGGIEYISIYSGDNLSPLIYIARGTSKTPVVNDAFITQEVLGSGDNRWMCEIALQFQTVADTGGTPYDVADIVRLHVGRPIDTTTTWGNNSVVRTLAYTDNLFGPVNAAKIWNVAANVQTEWLSLNDRRVVDGHRIEPTQPFIETVERGVAFQTDQVIFFAASVAYLKTTAASVPLGKGAVGGFSPKGSFIEGAALFDGFQLDSRKIQDTPPGAGAPIDVNILTLVPRDGTSLPEGFLLLAIKNSDLTSLVTAATAQLSPDHEMNLVLEEQFPGGGGNFSFAGKNYHRYLVKVRGLGITSFQNTDVVPGAGSVYVYSDDGLFFATPAIDITKIVPPTYTPDPEEQRAIDRPEPKTLIDVDNTMSTTLSGFVSGVSNSAIPDDASAKTALQGEIETFGLDAWQAAKTYTSGGVPDDRPLYWARLRMMAGLKRHNHMLSNAADRDALVKLLEWTTRGFTEVRYSGTGVPAGAVGAKKILVSGFDPFQLPADINRTNPSGVIALALDGFLADDGNGHKGYVQSVIFPVRYRDFDAGMLDEFFKEYLYGPDKVDMIITMSQNGGSPYFDIERFAGRTRGGFPDNVDAKLSGPVGSGTGWKEFFETTLPVTQMMSRVTIGTGQGVYFDQSYSLKKNNGSTVTLNHPTAASNASPNQKQKDNSIDVKTGVKSAIEGSGGDYLSNEIFYRVAHLRDVKPAGQSAKSTVKYGHLHVPGSAWTNADMIQKVKDLITDALSGL